MIPGSKSDSFWNSWQKNKFLVQCHFGTTFNIFLSSILSVFFSFSLWLWTRVALVNMFFPCMLDKNQYWFKTHFLLHAALAAERDPEQPAWSDSYIGVFILILVRIITRATIICIFPFLVVNTIFIHSPAAVNEDCVDISKKGIGVHTLRSLLNKLARLTILRKFSTLLALIRVLLA